MIEFTVRLVARGKPSADPRPPTPPVAGPFTESSFSEWVGNRVQVTGLDPAYQHVLVGVETAPDGWTCVLTVQTTAEHEHGVDVTAGLSVILGTPKAHVRVHDAETGEQLATAALDAPLALGKYLTVHGDSYVVVDETWPYRDPAHPEDTEDYQHVTARPVESAPDVTSLGLSGPEALIHLME